MTRRTPGHRAGIVVGVIAALALGFVAGAASSDHGTRSAPSPITSCSGSRHDAFEQARAAACLLNAYLALVNQPASVRDSLLAGIVLPAELGQVRAGYRTLGSAPVNPPRTLPRWVKITAEYAAVVAVRPGTLTDPGVYDQPDVGWTAWLCQVDAFASGSPPLANWYLGHFAVRWQSGRWWLSDEFHADEIATPMTYTQGPETRPFAPGWVGV